MLPIIALLLIVTSNPAVAASWEELYKKAKENVEKKNYDEALQYARQSLDAAAGEYGDSTVYHGKSCSKIAEIYFVTGNFDLAESYFIKTMNYYEKSVGRTNTGYASAVNNISVIYQYQGKIVEALELLELTLEIKKENVGEDNLSYAKSLNNLGRLYQETGKYQKAEEVLSKALEIKKDKESSDNISYAKSALNLALLYKTLGNYEKSLKYFNESVPVLRDKLGLEDPETSKAVINLGLVYVAAGKTNDAEKILNLVKRIETDEIGNSYPERAFNLYNLAMFYWAFDRVDETENYIEEALEIVRQKLGEQTPLYSSCLNSLGVIKWVNKDFDEAERFLAQAAELRKKYLGEKHPDYATTLHNLAGLQKDMGSYKSAEDNYRKAFNLYLDQIHEYFAFLSEDEKARYYMTLKERFEMFDNYVISRYNENPDLLNDMYNFRIATKAILLKSNLQVKRRISKSGDEELLEMYEKWQDTKKALAKAYTANFKTHGTSKSKIDSLEQYSNKLEKELSKASKVFGEEYKEENKTWEDVRDALKEDEAAVEIIRFRYFERGWDNQIFYAALIVTDETRDHPDIVFLNKGNELEDKFSSNYRKSIKFRLDDDYSYESFWKKIDEKLGHKTSIYVSPDGVYNRINMNSLQKEDGKYVLDEKYIRVVTNTAELIPGKVEKQKDERKDGAFLFGYPEFKMTGKKKGDKSELDVNDTLRSPTIPALPGTKDEIEKIGSILKKKKVRTELFMQEKATEKKVKEINNPFLLHIASHGYFLSDLQLTRRSKAFGVDIDQAHSNPLLRSGLLFSGAANYLTDYEVKEEEENGILTAFEAMNLNLEKTNLVVLSACETGLGEVQNGEGVYGLQRAFRVAGAKNIIMSLWKVDDKTTQMLMTNFYENWVSGMDFMEAFKNAQLKLKEKYPHPYFWGAFVIVGI